MCDSYSVLKSCIDISLLEIVSLTCRAMFSRKSKENYFKVRLLVIKFKRLI